LTTKNILRYLDENRANLALRYGVNPTVAEEEEAEVVFTEEDEMFFEIFRRKQKIVGDGDKKSVNEESFTSSFP
jgi:hypothetical protein